MTRRILKSAVLSGLFLSTHAFKLTFFTDGSTCGGTALGTFVGGEAQSCRQDFVGVAGGVVIESTGTVDENNMVVFYRTGDCNPDDEIAQGNIDCIGVANGGLPEYLSFNIVAEPTNPAVRVPSKARGLSRNQARADTIPDVVSFSHGDTHLADGQKYRMHQVYSTGFFAIPEDEWDENTHIHNKEDLPPMDESLARRSEMFSSLNYTNRSLDERAFNFNTCKVGIHCAKAELATLAANVGTAGVNLAQAAPAWIANAATAAQVRGLGFVDFINENAFYCAISTGVAFGAVEWVAGRFGGPPCPDCISNCSNIKDQTDAILSAIQELRPSQLASLSALTITVTDTVTDTTSFLSLSTIGCDQAPVGNQCNIPSGFCQPNVGAAGTTTPSFD